MAVRELDSAPRMRALYPRAIAGAARGALPGLGRGKRELPQLELALPDIEIDRRHLAAYDRVCGFRLRDLLPPTYPHVLAFPLAMELMTASDFPFPVIGLVHIANRIEQLRPIGAGERLSIRVRAEGLAPHERGSSFDVLAEARAGDELAWRSSSTYLRRENGGSSRREERPEPPRPSATWRLPGDIGRRYAEVSGDRNPIHLHRLTARPFGMPRPIAHGMWLKAHCLAALEGLVPDSLVAEVRFKLPVRLPGRVRFASWAEDGRRAFALHDAKGEKPHLAGSVEPA